MQSGLHRVARQADKDDAKWRKEYKKKKDAANRKKKKEANAQIEENKAKFKTTFLFKHNGLSVSVRSCRGQGSFPERKIEQLLIERGIIYLREVKFGGKMFFYDFYLPQFKTVIEYDGVDFHSNPSDVIRDSEKSAYLKHIGVRLRSFDKTCISELPSYLDSLDLLVAST